IPATAAAKVTGLTSCQAINASGKYRLEADVTAAPFANCFEISASNVTLNFNGHMITPGELGRAGVEVETGTTSANIVGPGTITGWMVEAILLNGDNGSVRGVTA